MLIERSKHNPVLKPNPHQSWEADAVFNGCPIKVGNYTYLVYRAVSLPHYHTRAGTRLKVSDIGIAKSKDGVNFSDRQRLIISDQIWDRFGCEDPRITKLNNKYYIFYTALSEYPFRADGIKVGVAISQDLKTIQAKRLVTPFNAKAMALFPAKIGGKMWAVLSANTDRPPAKICLASFDSEEDMWSESRWQKWYKNIDKYALPLQRSPNDQVEVGAPPLKTSKGWLLLYSYIQNYGTPKQLFSVEAVLLDLKNPQKIIARTINPLFTPEEYYEKFGQVPNIVFPSGAMIKNDTIYLYYGATDTTCCLAMINLPDLLWKMTRPISSIRFLWNNEKQIMAPVKTHPWESKAIFNPAAIYLGGKTHLLYRAMSEDNTSVFGYASSKNGIDIDYRSKEPAYSPREPFEQKLNPGGNSGCEDPRLTLIGRRIYMCYTAYDGKNSPRIALTSILAEDFIKQEWFWTKPTLISPPEEYDKDACLFPEKIKGKYVIIHRGGYDMDLSFHENLNFYGGKWLEEYRWMAPRPGMWDSRKVGISAPPIKTRKGWLILYHGISEDGTYRVGAALADLRDPAKIIARTDESIFEPRYSFQKNGQVGNVVFPCGAVVIGKKLIMYYGGADQVIGVASMPLEKLLKILETCEY
ncbi:MAG: hypothetical protein Q7S36_01025 [Candidatus Liptonbacteria bacterium]|nr:hypothetical protein [Candidatus Liptonbacteria bacterium]